MKNKLTVFCIMVLMGSVLMYSTPIERQDLYIKAVSEKDLQVKIQLLKEYQQLYGQQQDNYLKFVYIQLAESLFQVKNYTETIVYGEKALEYTEIPATNKLTVLFALANSYYQTQKDLQKAFAYGTSMVEIAQWVMDKAKNSELEKDKLIQFIDTYKNFYIAPVYRLQAMIVYSKDKQNPEVIKEAAQKAISAFLEDQSENSAKLVFFFAGELFKMNLTDDAIALSTQAFDESNPNPRFATFLATLYYKINDKEKAIHYFELAYKTDRDIKTAMKIGQLVYKKDIDKGIQYFADAYIMSSFDENSQAYKFLQQLYYHQKAKGLPAQEQDKGFNDIIQAAKARVGVENTHQNGSTSN